MASIIITGSSGFIGGELVKCLSEKGHSVFAFQRTTDIETQENIEYVKYDLNAELEDEYFEKATICIHTAYVNKYPKGNDVNVTGGKKLVDKCVKHNVKLIFLSSLSAQQSIPSGYSMSKLEIENYMDIKESIVLKLGLVIGNGGLFQNMYHFIKKSSVAPIFDGGKQPLQFICISDVRKTVDILVNDFQPGKFVVRNETPIEIRAFYKKLAKHLNKKIILIPFSSNFMLAMLKIIESIGISLPITCENLIGLKHMNTLSQFLPKGLENNKLKTLDESLDNFR